MGAEIKNCSFIDLGSLVLGCVYLRIVLHEVTYSLDEIAVLLLGLEIFLLR